jgi:hypothetical protein
MTLGCLSNFVCRVCAWSTDSEHTTHICCGTFPTKQAAQHGVIGLLRVFEMQQGCCSRLATARLDAVLQTAKLSGDLLGRQQWRTGLLVWGLSVVITKVWGGGWGDKKVTGAKLHFGL